jgi:hypothetical protein
VKVFKSYLTLKTDQRGGTLLTLIVFSIFVFALIGAFHAANSHAASYANGTISSGLSGDCLDDYHSSKLAGALVDAYGCNGTNAQVWQVNTITISHDNLCLSVVGNGNKVGDKVDLNKCNGAPGQVWLQDKNDLYNPGSKLCLDVPGGQGGVQLDLASCTDQVNLNWSSPMLSISCDGINGEGSRVACYAEKDWETWQSGTISHESLLNTYTDGAPYEEWCADFVSYVYKQAGYPFKGGEADGWDENNANNIINMGFSEDASSYTPLPGDVGYFNYAGGHVEIVISGGKVPTFIYGNSATIDPTTGNGQMEANTILYDGDRGSIAYYMSPT